ncbi:unnamed protein product [Dovyalis caffra]|uniref:Uncharacterized protein n=1 Tax=Dovyalis caffra TaxID=77055 RepID=A0AAV1RJE8_9ROSI|nr:unnamed protein product [Dovyalis caffra]
MMSLNLDSAELSCEPFWYIVMGTEVPKDPFKGVDWKAIGGELQKDPSAGAKPIIKKRLPKRLGKFQTTISFLECGIGAGMLLEMWINKKVKEDGGIIWEFDK